MKPINYRQAEGKYIDLEGHEGIAELEAQNRQLREALKAAKLECCDGQCGAPDVIRAALAATEWQEWDEAKQCWVERKQPLDATEQKEANHALE